MIKIGCSGTGLKLAIEHAFEEMEKEGSDGFSYPIGEINGHHVYITWEDKSKSVRDTIEFESDGLTYNAVYEKK